MVTLSGELEIEANDLENNNGNSKDLRHKPRKTRRKIREERQDSNSNGRDVSPKVFKTGTKNKTAKPGMLHCYLCQFIQHAKFNCIIYFILFMKALARILSECVVLFE